ncbi:Acetyltransferase (GNAT) domain-containing protein [Cohaesibacter sp. ES.047]|uniref:GNAT family N-acetyltransferase n=1 Tax=Cohaesibacter sp. ES.047 TaxID=1798205 RepID=UPI000BC0CACA|nr:GNAT family N-acetyltransferase [Cohaesibacter sp. ES.047]SNY93132.1 Acetyltransferase (GNAT) domain-containing protein [Cohaesibacter sp. ES.047]
MIENNHLNTVYEATCGSFTITTDQSLLDMHHIVDRLKNEAYWAQDANADMIAKAMRNSLVFCLRNEEGAQCGFARVVTDFALFAYLRDVFIDRGYRGQGLGSWITETALSHPELKDIPSWMLATEDAHGVYEKMGFHPLKRPDNYMQRLT